MSEENICDFVGSAAEAWPHEPALADRQTGRVVSFAELDCLTRPIAWGLLAQEIKICATYLPISLDHILFLTAALRAGVPIFPLSPRWPIERAQEMAARTNATLWENIDFPTGSARRLQARHPAWATLIATSGSSGTPKRVAHALGAHLANARASQDKLPLAPGCGWLLNLPLAHVSGLSVLFRCVTHGATMVLPAPGEFETAMLDPRVTHLSVVSTQLHRLLEKQVRFPFLRAMLAGGGPFTSALLNQAIAAGYPVHLTYGMTEAGSQITTTRRLTEPAHAFSAGTPNPGFTLRIGADGGLEVRSPALCSGYLLDDGTLCSAADPEGWFVTGDRGRIDEAGNFWYSGRADRMFISGGENIHPETIERELESLPEIRRAVVLPIADVTFGQRPVAFVAWNCRSIADTLSQRLQGRLPKFMVPVRFLDWPPEADLDQAKISLAVFEAQLSDISR